MCQRSAEASQFIEDLSMIKMIKCVCPHNINMKDACSALSVDGSGNVLV